MQVFHVRRSYENNLPLLSPLCKHWKEGSPIFLAWCPLFQLRIIWLQSLRRPSKSFWLVHFFRRDNIIFTEEITDAGIRFLREEETKREPLKGDCFKDSGNENISLKVNSIHISFSSRSNTHQENNSMFLLFIQKSEVHKNNLQAQFKVNKWKEIIFSNSQ